MENKLEELEKIIKEFVNEYDINEFRVDIFKLYKEKIINIRVDKNVN